MKSLKNILKTSNKNYFIVILVSILTIVITLYIRAFYLNYQVNELNHTIFYDNKINQISSDDLKFSFSETNEAILIVSYTGSSKVHSMEKKLYKEIKNKNLMDKITYWNIAEYKDSYLDILKNKFPNISDQIVSAPMFIYIKNGEAVEAYSSELKMVDYKAFNNLIEKYEIE